MAQFPVRFLNSPKVVHLLKFFNIVHSTSECLAAIHHRCDSSHHAARVGYVLPFPSTQHACAQKVPSYVDRTYRNNVMCSRCESSAAVTQLKTSMKISHPSGWIRPSALFRFTSDAGCCSAGLPRPSSVTFAPYVIIYFIYRQKAGHRTCLYYSNITETTRAT